MRSIVILLFCALAASATQTSYEGFKVFTVSTGSAEKVSALLEWETQGVDFWDSPNKINKPIRVMVPPLLLTSFEQFLIDNSFNFEVSIHNVETVFAEERRVMAVNRARHVKEKAAGRATVAFDYYWTYTEINDYLNTLASEYPSIATVFEAGRTLENRAILGLRISTNNFSPSVPVIFIDAGIHAREWIAPMTALYLIHELVEHPTENQNMLQNINWIILPIANPDGYSFSHTTTRMWRKNRRSFEGSTCYGVDCNRNYNYQWEAAAGTSDNVCSDVFRGEGPASELEVQAVSNTLLASTNVRLYLSIHSYGDYLLYPWGWATPPINHSNYVELQYLGDRVNAAIMAAGGPSYAVGNSVALLYAASGGSDDFAAGGAGINLAYTVELTGGGTQGFDLPPQLIERVAGEMFAGFGAYADYIANLAK